MKKISLIIALVLACAVLFASCSVTNPVEEPSTTESTQEVSETLSPEEQKEYDAVKQVAYNLAMAETREDIKACVIQYSDDYADYVLGGFPDDDYIIEVEKLIEYKGTLAFNVIVTCECDPEYIYSGIQLFSYTEDGRLLINLDEDIVEQFCKDFACEDCGSQGFTIELAQTSGGEDKYVTCENCDGIGFDFSKVTE